jgi:hypothetical protein
VDKTTKQQYARQQQRDAKNSEKTGMAAEITTGRVKI